MFLLLIAGVLIAVSASGRTVPLGYDPALAVMGTGILTLAGALSGLVFYPVARRRVALTVEAHRRRMRWLDRLTWVRRGILIGGYLYIIHGFHWAVFVSHTLGLGNAIALDEMLVLAPFLAALFGSIIVSFPAQQRLTGRAGSLRSYLVFVLRQHVAFLLLPWLMYVTVLDVLEFSVAPSLPVEWRTPVEWAVVLGLLFLLYVFWPLALRWLWPTGRLPDGPEREKLEALCRRAGVGYRDILVWRSPVGGHANAAVAGLAAPLRYILITDTLLERLAPAEVQAVLAHELGHVIRRHIPYYMQFALVFIFLALAAEVWVTGSVQEPFFTGEVETALDGLVFSGVVVALYWGLLFGWISRRFEREADLVAADLTGDAEVCAEALERIAWINGRPPERPGWRHFSIANRSAFLRASSTDTSLRRRALATAWLIRRLLVMGAWGVLAVLLYTVWPG